MQTTSHLLMIKPVRFDFNAETAVNNSFQQQSADKEIAQKATKEFDQFVDSEYPTQFAHLLRVSMSEAYLFHL